METEHQVALLAPKESQAFKNSMNGVGKMTHRYVIERYLFSNLSFRYSFSKIFQPSCGQAKVFGEVVAPKVKDFLEGQNQLLFTYGATSAGKTYTIQGVPGDSGIMPRAVDVIFNTVGDRISPQLPLQVGLWILL